MPQGTSLEQHSNKEQGATDSPVIHTAYIAGVSRNPGITGTTGERKPELTMVQPCMASQGVERADPGGAGCRSHSRKLL